jgi:hypothetical protein
MLPGSAVVAENVDNIAENVGVEGEGDPGDAPANLIL